MTNLWGVEAIPRCLCCNLIGFSIETPQQGPAALFHLFLMDFCPTSLVFMLAGMSSKVKAGRILVIPPATRVWIAWDPMCWAVATASNAREISTRCYFRLDPESTKWPKWNSLLFWKKLCLENIAVYNLSESLFFVDSCGFVWFLLGLADRDCFKTIGRLLPPFSFCCFNGHSLGDLLRLDHRSLVLRDAIPMSCQWEDRWLPPTLGQRIQLLQYWIMLVWKERPVFCKKRGDPNGF